MTARYGDAHALRDLAAFLRDRHQRHHLAALIEATADAIEDGDGRFADLDPARLSIDIDTLISLSYEEGVMDAEHSYDSIKAGS